MSIPTQENVCIMCVFIGISVVMEVAFDRCGSITCQKSVGIIWFYSVQSTLKDEYNSYNFYLIQIMGLEE